VQDEAQVLKKSMSGQSNIPEVINQPQVVKLKDKMGNNANISPPRWNPATNDTPLQPKKSVSNKTNNMSSSKVIEYIQYILSTTHLECDGFYICACR
jgi:hypothetical protein